ncbi:MAG: hypothetical protein AB7S77_11520 [Desulfatirhabdiaceae bacterium]
MNNVIFHKKATSQLSCICKIVKKKLFPECGYVDLNGVVSALEQFLGLIPLLETVGSDSIPMGKIPTMGIPEGSNRNEKGGKTGPVSMRFACSIPARLQSS